MPSVSEQQSVRVSPADTKLHAMIDIGSNAVKLAVCLMSETSTCQTVYLDERITRLNQGLDSEGNIDDATVEALLDAVGELTGEVRRHGAQIRGAVGTAALRKAKNSADVLIRLFDAHGLRTRILTPREEAAAGFIAVRDRQRSHGNQINGAGPRPLVTFDLGGRSAELTIGTGLSPDSYASLELGANQLMRRAPTSDPPVPSEIDRVRDLVRDQVKHLDRPPREADVWLVGATATTLTGYVPMLMAREYGPDGVDFLDREMLISLVEKLSRMTMNQRRLLPGNPERADIILHGAIAFEQVFKYLGFRHAQVSPDGVAMGVLLSEMSGIPLDFEPAHFVLQATGFRPLSRRDRDGEVLFALRRSDGRIWLQRKIDYPAGIYRIPGGGVDLGENPQIAFWRELREETSVSDVQVIPLATISYSRGDGEIIPFTSRLYLVEIGDLEPIPEDRDEGIEDYTPVAPADLYRWAARLDALSGGMKAWGAFRAAAVRTLLERLERFPV